MSIQTEIDRIVGNVTAALTACADKGASVPSGSTSDDLAAIIAAIEAGGGGELASVMGSITPAEATDTITITHNLGVVPKNIVFARNAKVGSNTARESTHMNASVHSTSGTKNAPFVASFGTLGFSMRAIQNYSGSSCSFGVASRANTDGVLSAMVTQADETTITLYANGANFTAQYYAWKVWG